MCVPDKQNVVPAGAASMSAWPFSIGTPAQGARGAAGDGSGVGVGAGAAGGATGSSPPPIDPMPDAASARMFVTTWSSVYPPFAPVNPTNAVRGQRDRAGQRESPVDHDVHVVARRVDLHVVRAVAQIRHGRGHREVDRRAVLVEPVRDAHEVAARLADVLVRVEDHRNARDTAVADRARVLAGHVGAAAALRVREHEGQAVGARRASAAEVGVELDAGRRGEADDVVPERAARLVVPARVRESEAGPRRARRHRSPTSRAAAA